MVNLTGARGQSVAPETLLKSMSLSTLLSLVVATEDAQADRAELEALGYGPETLTIPVAA